MTIDGAMMGTATMTVMGRAMMTEVTAMGRRGAGGVVVVAVVALLIPDLSPGGYSALNPTVGIEA